MMTNREFQRAQCKSWESFTRCGGLGDVQTPIEVWVLLMYREAGLLVVTEINQNVGNGGIQLSHLIENVDVNSITLLALPWIL